MQLELVPPGVPGEYRVILYPMGEDPAWARPLKYFKPDDWADAAKWQAMVGRMVSAHQVGLVEICFVEKGCERYGPQVIWCARATDVPDDPAKEN